MNFGGILAKLLRKPNAQNTAPDGWGGWLDTPEGKRWEATGEKVYDALATAKVNRHERRILVRDGAKLKKLTLNQVTRCVAEETGEENGTATWKFRTPFKAGPTRSGTLTWRSAESCRPNTA